MTAGLALVGGEWQPEGLHLVQRPFPRKQGDVSLGSWHGSEQSVKAGNSHWDHTQ